MADTTSIRIIGNWKNQMEIPLRDALHISHDVIGKSSVEAVKHCIIVMAKMARSLTKKSKKNRPVLNDQTFGLGKYVERWKQFRRIPEKVYQWQFSRTIEKKWQRHGTWENAKRIGASGLAKRSWLWGLRGLNETSEGKVIPGVATLRYIHEPKRVGYVLQNKLSYVTKAMPGGWEKAVEHKAVKQIMAGAARKMESAWKRHVAQVRKAA